MIGHIILLELPEVNGHLCIYPDLDWLGIWAWCRNSLEEIFLSPIMEVSG